MRKSAWIGIDVGGTKTRLALFDAKLQVLEDIKFPTPKEKKEFTADLKKCVRNLVKNAFKRKLALSGVGVGVAGSIDNRKKIVKLAPNVPFLKGYSLGKLLHGLCRCEIFLLNDVQAA